jgi:hypothetical protein
MILALLQGETNESILRIHKRPKVYGSGKVHLREQTRLRTTPQ